MRRLEPATVEQLERLLRGEAMSAYRGGQVSPNSLVHHGLVRLAPTGRLAAAVALGWVPDDRELRLIETLAAMPVQRAVSWAETEGGAITHAPSNTLRRFAERGLAQAPAGASAWYRATVAGSDLAECMASLDRAEEQA